MSIIKSKLGIMYFRRDLRLKDNTALNRCLIENNYILPLFIFDDRQISKTKNKYYSDKAFELLKIFLHDLNNQFMNSFDTDKPITFMHGTPYQVLQSLADIFNKYDVTVYFNIDFTPFSIQRDTDIYIKLTGMKVKSYCDQLLVNISQLNDIISYKQLYLENDSIIYKKFTPFHDYYKTKHPLEPETTSFKKIKHYAIKNSIEVKKILTLKNEYEFLQKYNRKHAINSLKNDIPYHLSHNDPSNENSTFNISHYIKFGVLSIREVYYAFKQLSNSTARTAAIRQLYWRDFYTLIAWSHPQLLGWKFDGFNSKEIPKWVELKENSCLYENYNKIKWSYDSNIIKAWQTGNTGFPIIDAGMRQLLASGYMHNRLRLITACFLTKICGIDWRVGEEWFANHLIDYDPIMNNGNWLWVAGGGADSQPYFRIFNPWIQQKTYDPECNYIKKWVPELKDVEPKIIHKAFKIIINNYTSPIIDYNTEKVKTFAKYKKVFE